VKTGAVCLLFGLRQHEAVLNNWLHLSATFFYFPDLRVRIMRQFIREVTIGQHVHSAEQCLLLTATKNNGGTSTSDVYCGVTRTAF
jgi:hypothetical protein